MNNGWNDFEAGTVLFSFNKKTENIATVLAEDRPYSKSNSFTASVADWRIKKPIFNKEYCIDCQFCWVFCPDTAIISRDKKMIGIDYVHCKGCLICVEVCPTNPKSLLMFDEADDEDEAIRQWPKKNEKVK